MDITKMQLKFDMDNRPYFECGETDKTVGEVFKAAFAQDGRRISRLELDCGMAHPRLAIAMHDNERNPGILTYLIAFEEMGYDITLTKREAD